MIIARGPSYCDFQPKQTPPPETAARPIDSRGTFNLQSELGWIRARQLAMPEGIDRTLKAGIWLSHQPKHISQAA